MVERLGEVKATAVRTTLYTCKDESCTNSCLAAGNLPHDDFLNCLLDVNSQHTNLLSFAERTMKNHVTTA
jgi:hypothetical protein